MLFHVIVLLCCTAAISLKSHVFGNVRLRRALHVARIDEMELTKLFGRLADKTLLLDVEGAGTPAMANCCHGGCDNCPYSRYHRNIDRANSSKILISTLHCSSFIECLMNSTQGDLSGSPVIPVGGLLMAENTTVLGKRSSRDRYNQHLIISCCSFFPRPYTIHISFLLSGDMLSQHTTSGGGDQERFLRAYHWLSIQDDYGPQLQCFAR